MISFYTLVTILVCHFIFDFFFQTDAMAKNKSKCNDALSEHVFIYTVGLAIMAVLNCLSFPSFAVGATFVAINCVSHWFTDYFSSRSTSRLYKDEEYHDFFATIGLDQLVHYVTLFGTFIWLTGK
jgi:hypothetical protein